MRLASLLLTGAAAVELQATSPLSKVVKMLEKTLDDLLDERTIKEKSFEKTSCLTKKTTEKNNELIKESESSIEEMKEELSLLGAVTLTDEGRILATKIDDKKKEVTSLVQELDSMTEAHNANVADLSSGAAALVAAESQIQGKSFLAQKQTIKRALSNKKLSSRQQAFLSEALQQAPQEYSSQVGAITELIVNLKQQYQKEQVTAKQNFNKNSKAQTAVIDEANAAVATLQQEFEAGEGEAAAKQKRSDELNDSMNAAQKLIDDAKTSNVEMSKMQDHHSAEWKKFIEDSSNQEAAINKAIEILGNDEARAQFQTVADNANPSMFLQVGAEAKSQAIDTLRSAIKDMKAELEEEKDNIISSVNKCEKDSLNLLENAKEASEQMDGFSANIRALEKKIESEKEKQAKFTKEIADRVEELEDATKVYEEQMTGLKQVHSDLMDAKVIVNDAVRALQEYEYQSSGKSDYHEETKTSPLAGVITMLENIASEMKTKIAARDTEMRVATEEHDALRKKIGSTSEIGGDDDQFVSEIVAPDSLIGDLEAERNASLSAMNDAQQSLNADNVNYQNNQQSLKGMDGKSGLIGAFNEMQPGCDYWMVNAPGRKSEISDEISSLIQADTILSNQDLGMGSEDTMVMGSREKGADAKDHEFAHVGSE